MEKVCIHKHLYRNRLQRCPLGCGVRIAKKDILDHVAYECNMRLSSCPNGCGNTFKVSTWLVFIIIVLGPFLSRCRLSLQYFLKLFDLIGINFTVYSMMIIFCTKLI
jgi:hypothetical protein